jgi:hypothetical protein
MLEIDYIFSARRRRQKAGRDEHGTSAWSLGFFTPGEAVAARIGSFHNNNEHWLVRTISLSNETIETFRDAVRERDRRCAK